MTFAHGGKDELLEELNIVSLALTENEKIETDDRKYRIAEAITGIGNDLGGELGLVDDGTELREERLGVLESKGGKVGELRWLREWIAMMRI